MKTVAVIEGFVGGPMHTKELRKALTRAGFKVTKDRTRADIIIAHSAGISAIPTAARAKLLLLIGPPYWPGKSLIIRVLKHSNLSTRHTLENFGWRRLAKMRVLGFYYFFRRSKYTWLGLKNDNKLDRLNMLNKRGRKIILVRNDDDAITAPGIRQVLSGSPIKVVTLPGIHDDYYTNPQPYIDLLLKEL